MKFFSIVLFLLILKSLVAYSDSNVSLKLPSWMSNHMVLPAGQDVKINGTAKPDAKVKINFFNSTFLGPLTFCSLIANTCKAAE